MCFLSICLNTMNWQNLGWGNNISNSYFTLSAVVYEIILLVSFTQEQSCCFSITVIKVKGKGVPVFNHAHAMKAHEEVEVQCQTFLILVPDKRWVVSFCVPVILPLGKEPTIPKQQETVQSPDTGTLLQRKKTFGRASYQLCSPQYSA